MLWIVSLILSTGLVLSFIAYQIRSQSSITESSQEQGMHIPEPDYTVMEPQVAKLISDAHLALVNDLESADAWGNYAKALDAHKLYPLSLVCYQRAYDLNPSDQRWSYLMGTVMEFENADLDEILKWYRIVENLLPQYPPLYLRIGNILMKKGAYNDARDAYQSALEIDDAFGLAHRNLGQVLMSLNDITAAIEHLESAASLTPKDSVVFTSLAQAYNRDGFTDEAEEASQKAKQLRPQNWIPDPLRDTEVDQISTSSVARAYQAGVHLRAGEYEKAIEDMKVVIEVRPDDPYPHIKMANIYRGMKNTDEVIRHLENAVKLQDDLVDVHLQLGRIYTVRRDFDNAIKHYKSATVHKPERASIRIELATLLGRNNQLHEANEEFEMAASMTSLNARVQADWATTLARGGDYKKAAEHFIESIRLEPNFVETHANLGRTYEQLGSLEKAIESYKRAVKIDPEHRSAQRLAELQQNITTSQ